MGSMGGRERFKAVRFALAQKTLVFLSALAAALPLLLSGEIGWAFQMMLLIAWISSWFIPVSVMRDSLYRRIVTSFVLVFTVFQIVRIAKGAPFAGSAMEFVVVLAAAKLLSRASAGDDYQIAILSFLHIVAAAAVTDTVLFGFSFIAFTALLPPDLAMIHLRREMEQRFGPGSKVKDAKEGLERLFRSRRVVSLRFVLGASLLSVPILVITAVLFVLFPRMSIGLFSRIHTEKRTVGFGESVALRDEDINAFSDRVLVRLEPVTQSTLKPSGLSLKMRVMVLDTFDGERWTRKVKEKWNPIPLQQTDYVLAPKDTPALAEYEVLQEFMTPKLLCLPDGTGDIRTESVSDKEGDVRPRRLTMDQTGQIEYEDDSEIGIKFRARITGAAPPGRPPMEGDPYLTFPKNDRIALTAKTLAGDGTDRERAERLIFNLKSQYRYSLKLAGDERNLKEKTSLERFLYSRRSGTCEHFATALTLMLRAVGIPARLITGFMGADFNLVGGFYSVRERNAHAWTEAFIDGRWTTLDAVPSAEGASAEERPFFLAMLIETLEMKWRKHVIGYDLGTQGKLAVVILRKLRYMRGDARSFLNFQKQLFPILAVILPLVVVAFLIYRYRSRFSIQKARQPSRRASNHCKQADEIFVALERRLRQLGRPRPVHLTLYEHLSSLRPDGPILVDNVLRIARRYNEVRFGRRPFAEGEPKRLMKSIREIGRSNERGSI